MAALPARHHKFQAVVKQGLKTFIGAAKPRRGAHRRLVAPVVPPMPSAAEAVLLDPVELTVLAVNRLGAATVRTAMVGKPATVTVPDARTAEIFRAALKQMQKTRRTDRLVDIVVAGDGGGMATNLNPGAQVRDTGLA